MARPEKCRKICYPPKMEGFRPYGMPKGSTKPVELKFEEFESIRLVDYNLLSQEIASTQMNVSRPTFTRIYNRALRSIAKALVEGRAIEIEGGNCRFEKDWYKCKKCHKLIEGVDNHLRCKDCNAYSLNELISMNLSVRNEVSK